MLLAGLVCNVYDIININSSSTYSVQSTHSALLWTPQSQPPTPASKAPVLYMDWERKLQRNHRGHGQQLVFWCQESKQAWPTAQTICSSKCTTLQWCVMVITNQPTDITIAPASLTPGLVKPTPTLLLLHLIIKRTFLENLAKCFYTTSSSSNV